MEYAAEFINLKTGEKKEVTVALTETQCRAVETVRKLEGDDQAQLIGQAYTLNHVYRSVLSPHEWNHTHPPMLLQ